MNNEIKRVYADLETAALKHSKSLYIARDAVLQQMAIEEFEAFLKRLGDIKKKAVTEGDEDSANAALSISALIDSFINELKMYLCLKSNEPNKAWDYLIKAQRAGRVSFEAHPITERFEKYPSKLLLLEKTLFPSQMFTSVAMVIGKSVCSICGEEYKDCEHLVGKAYMGEVCFRIHHEIAEVIESSFVDEPADKHCRVTEYWDGVSWIDTISGIEVEGDPPENPDTPTLNVTILSNPNIYSVEG